MALLIEGPCVEAHLLVEWCRCQHGGVTTTYSGHLLSVTKNDGPKSLCLQAMLFDEDGSAGHEPWRTHAHAWFDRFVDDASCARFGDGTRLVVDVINGAKVIDADRVDLNAPVGGRARGGFPVARTRPSGRGGYPGCAPLWPV